MDSNVFMGLLIGALVVLLGGASIIVAIIVKPIINLNTKITKLDQSIEVFNSNISRIEQRIEKHGKELDDVNKDLKDFEGRISKLEAK